MKYIDSILDRITMYKLLLYYLLTILAAALVFGSIGSLAYSPVAITLSAWFFCAGVLAGQRRLRLGL